MDPYQRSIYSSSRRRKKTVARRRRVFGAALVAVVLLIIAATLFLSGGDSTGSTVAGQGTSSSHLSSSGSSSTSGSTGKSESSTAATTAGVATTAAGPPATTKDTPSTESESRRQGAVSQAAIRAASNRAGDPKVAASDIATREQLAVCLARVLSLPDTPAPQFDDLSTADWGYKKIGAVVHAGLMAGTSAAKFSPHASVTREQAVAAIVATLQYFAEEKGTDLGVSLEATRVSDWLAGFRDRKLINPAYSSAAAVAFRLGLFDASSEGWLLPKLSMTRRELLGMLERALAEPLLSKTTVPTAVDPVDAYPDLSMGSKSGVVLLLQRRLNSLTYYCGTPDGAFADQTRDAVYAFQKYQRLKRTGVVDKSVWKALLAASAPVPVYKGDARRVEVDLTRQIMMLIKDNKVVMTVHVSTGVHGTPTGDWHIRTRGRGWHMTTIGEAIYAPAYFMERNAIHGYPEVPTYPASHNCVRTPIWLQDRVVDQLVMGELVHIFYNKAK
jgi:peptidoglycan hydrolase-like protein with peptidoglycan-binding domain